MEDVVTYLGSKYECRGPKTYRSKPTRTILSREKLLLSVLHALDLGPMLGSCMGCGSGMGMRPLLHGSSAVASPKGAFEIEAYQVVIPTSSGAGLLEQALSSDLRGYCLRDSETKLFNCLSEVTSLHSRKIRNFFGKLLSLFKKKIQELSYWHFF